MLSTYKISALTLSIFICPNLYSAMRQVRVINKTQESITVYGQQRMELRPDSTRLVDIDTAQPLRWQITTNARQSAVNSSAIDTQTIKIKFEQQQPVRFQTGRQQIYVTQPNIICRSEIGLKNSAIRKTKLVFYNYCSGLSFGYMPKPANSDLSIQDYRLAEDSNSFGKVTTLLLMLYGIIWASN